MMRDSTMTGEPKGIATEAPPSAAGPAPQPAPAGPRAGPAAPAPAWGPAKRVLFRFVFVYLVLYNLPFLLDFDPGVVTWVGRHVFGVEITVLPNGSGDTTYNYVQVFCYAVVAVAVSALWTLLARNRAGYPRLHEWLRVYVRFWLAAAMITYGAIKVIKSQFPYPSLDRLLEPFGEASPMGLLWTFMGASHSYNVFAGAGEMLGGLLLTTRRTTLLGALVSLGVLGNVAMLNFSYDVPVKLYSCHLLFMAAFLAAPDLRRLADLFVLGRGVGPVNTRPLFRNRWLNGGALVVRTVLVAGYVGWWLFLAQEMRHTYGDLRPRPPLHGIWVVEEFALDGEGRPPLVTDPARWRRVVWDYPNTMAVQLMSDTRVRYALELDADARTLALSKRDDPAWKAVLSYEEPGPGLVTLRGTLDGHRLRARLRRLDESRFLLLDRGFHWINEYPFNR
jgi:hypothetical protein